MLNIGSALALLSRELFLKVIIVVAFQKRR
ncbi:hypothetical protein UAB78_058 [Escherichia phage UAB_Phi78]|uniref:Uncharacterized protein n=1 Tax=Escherichia phage UAB_Phi78 TaxID=979726 RepID=A0A8F5JAI2_9CAUD|nr:hypothetical protein I132_gp58 [Escherichia phage UAB_Phi78]QXM18136.1 hypothetical protein UAB78_058 [Escherichia phage UAB_Phi78]